MLEYIKSDEMVSINDVEGKYDGCVYLLVDVDNDFNDFRGSCIV